jgi:LAO/AO transport system kinase
VLISGLENIGLAEMWEQVVEHRRRFEASGEGAKKRREQQVKWMWTMLEDFFHARLRGNPAVRAMLPAIERKVAEGALSPNLAVEQIVSALGLTH